MIALALLLAALPPLPPFPTELRPRDQTTAPANASIFALGDPAPAVDQVGVAVTIAGAPASVEPLEAIGCCVVRAGLTTAPAVGDVVTVTVTSASGESSATWTAGPVDDTAPTFSAAPSVIDHGQRAGAYEIVVGLEVADDTQIGMVTAIFQGDLEREVLGATVDGFVLTARVPGEPAPGELCLSLVAVDVAENESAPEVLCVTVAAPSEGEGEGEGEVPGCTSAGTPTALVMLAMLALLRRRAGSLVPLGAMCAVLAGSSVAHAGDAKADAKGVTWSEGALDDVMKRAKAEKKLVLVEVWAAWCGPCKRQAADVFETDDGAALTKGMLAWRVDFDEPAQRALMEKWNVLSLPTVLVLRPDGTEVDRIEGYETKDAFLVEARALAKGVDPLPVLEKKLATADAAERAKLTLEVGHRKLVRGDPEGLRLLERAILEPASAEDALFLVGRYHSRVKRDFATAKHVWRELLTRFPAGTFANTAAWWYAGALHETGDDELAVDLLEQRARTFDKSALESLVDFAAEKTLKGVDARKTARRVLDDAVKARAIDDASLAPLRAKLDAPPKS